MDDMFTHFSFLAAGDEVLDFLLCNLGNKLRWEPTGLMTQLSFPPTTVILFYDNEDIALIEK
jgi:hypothetical protein